MRYLLFIALILLVGCSPVPIYILNNPPTQEVAPSGYSLVKSYDFTYEADRPPTAEISVMEVWGIDGVCRKSGGMYNPDGSLVPANDPRNYIEWNPKQVYWNSGYIILVTDLNDNVDGTPIVSGKIATVASYEAPVYIAVRMNVSPQGGTYWNALVSYSPNGHLPENDYAEFECEDSKAFTSSFHREGKGIIGTKKHKFPVDLSSNFHIYAADIQTNRVIIYLDNVKIWEFQRAGLNVEPFYFVIENAIFGGANPDLISPENLKKMFPMDMKIDYLKIYKP